MTNKRPLIENSLSGNLNLIGEVTYFLLERSRGWVLTTPRHTRNIKTYTFTAALS